MTKEFANTTTKAVRANVKRMAESAVGAGVPAAGSAGSVPVVVGDPVGDPVVGDPVGDPVVGDPVVGDPVVGDPVGDPVVGDPVVGVIGDPVVGDPVGDPVVGDPVGDPVVGDPVVGDPVVGDPVVGATKKMVIIRSHIGLSLQLLDADIILI